MTIELPKLNYELDGLQPHISKETLEYHYGKHHKAYVDKLNKAIESTKMAEMSLEEIVMNSEGGVFNNAAQVWNHSFYWNCLSPSGGGEPSGALMEAIKKDFGSFDSFKKEFTEKSLTLFGSGWAWLVKTSDGKLEITQTFNADLPMKHKKTALLTCDVWEHAYYVDYRNARPNYLEAFWKLVNWDFVSKNLG